ncbi:response regulator, partial [Mycobacterium tuberculosis]|nr:response regulator [Mycobacterium tuberculosis]
MKSILVVEDEDRISSFIAKGLGAAGFTTEIAADGITGRDLAITGDFDLLVLDIGLPGLDGF